jgi:HD superfamily phosphohydrolase
MVQEQQPLQNIEIAVKALSRFGLDSLLSFGPVKRLANVSFLGVANEIYHLSRRSDRLEHTLSVVFWADRLCDLLNIPEKEHRILLCTYLLHDLGHGPFSHNSEPFMIECLNVYHQGLGSIFLQQKNRFGGESQTLTQRLQELLGDDAERVLKALMKTNDTAESLAEFLASPINVDKIEGNSRSANELDLPYVAPVDMLETLLYEDGRFAVKADSLERIIEFWRRERQLYWEKLYTDAIFGGEAVLTRILHILHAAGINEDALILATDEEILKMAGKLEQTQKLCNNLRKGEAPRSLSVTHASLFASVAGDLRRARFEPRQRAAIERKIASQLGILEGNVISHLSRRKYFGENFDDLFQIELFNERAKVIPLSRIRSAFSASKRSGDLIDIYYFEE